MKFRREYSADFHFTGLETFSLTASNGFQINGQSINDILHAAVSQPQVNAAETRNAKRKIVEVSSSDDEDSTPTSSTSASRNRSHRSLTPTTRLPPPLTCSPAYLWHLRYAHASTTALSKLKQIKSSHDSTKCTIYIRVKKTKNPFHLSNSKTTTKLGRIYFDICG